jgi:predicted ATP-grasp superfamily ATP-dependent carboligase
MRLERWCSGMAASVALLCGPTGVLPLAPCAQTLSDDGRLRYLGGWTPLSEPLRSRAEQLARRAAACLPTTVGYLGMDMVLGEEPGSDVVIEINPRLTTSYLGLRRLARENLADAMLGLANGRQVELSFARGRVEFAAAAKLEGGGPAPEGKRHHAVAGNRHRRRESQVG